MNRTFNINILIMFILSFGLAYLSIKLSSHVEPHSVAFMLGRATSSVLFPLIVVYIPLLFIRRGKPKFTKGAYITLWVLFTLLSILALIGSAIENAS